MDNLIADVAGETGVAPETARKAVALILDFLKREAPEDAMHTLFDKAPALRAITATAGNGGEGLGGTLRGLMGTGSGAMGGGGLMALAATSWRWGLAWMRCRRWAKKCSPMRAKRVATNSSAKSPRRSRACRSSSEAALTPFPVRSEADWRKAAEAALKGGAFDALESVTSDEIALGPLHAGRSGARAWRSEAGPWKALSRVDHPSPDDFNEAAREELANGADGLVVVFAGSGAAYGFGLKGDPAGLARAFDGLSGDGARFSLDIAEFAQAEAFAAFVERSGADVSFGLDPIGLRARGASAPGAAALKAAAEGLRSRGFRGPFAAADARCVHDAGGTPAQELAFALAAGVAYLRVLEDPSAIEFRLAADADQFATLAKFRAARLLWRGSNRNAG